MKRLAILLLAALLTCAAASGCAIPLPAPAAETVSPAPEATQTPASTDTPAPSALPVTQYPDFAALLAAVPGLTLNDAPSGSDGFGYNVIQIVPQTAQITFYYDGYDYDYRVALCASESAQIDIAQTGLTFPPTEALTASTGEPYVLSVEQGGTAALAAWYNADAACQYTLFTKTGGANREIVQMVETMLPLAASISGTVYQIDGNVLRLQLANNDFFSFQISDATLISGAAAGLAVGETVTVTYEGTLISQPRATAIRIITVPTVTPTPTPQPTNDPLVNKSLTGDVITYTSKKLTVLLSNGKQYTFVMNAATVILGNYALEEDCLVTVTYDGYASEQPPAKVVQVLSAPQPTIEPTYRPVVLNTVSGNIQMHAGNALTILTDDGVFYSFLLKAPTITGDPETANYATITYYEDADGQYQATRVDFSIVLLDDGTDGE